MNANGRIDEEEKERQASLPAFRTAGILPALFVVSQASCLPCSPRNRIAGILPALLLSNPYRGHPACLVMSQARSPHREEIGAHPILSGTVLTLCCFCVSMPAKGRFAAWPTERTGSPWYRLSAFAFHLILSCSTILPRRFPPASAPQQSVPIFRDLRNTDNSEEPSAPAEAT